MAFTKITDADLQGKGVVGQAPVPGLPVKEMQESVEQIVREVAIPGINRLADELSAQTAAKNIGMQVPDGMPGGASANVSSVVGTHVLAKGNPHNVTASQVGAYTKAETEQAINQKVQDIGAGDMSKAEYDPNNRGNKLIPIGYIFTWAKVDGGPDLSTAEKVAEYFGFGTWAEYGSGRVLVGLDTGQTEFSEIGKEGGEKNHQLSISEMPKHTHRGVSGDSEVNAIVDTGQNTTDFGLSFESTTSQRYIAGPGGLSEVGGGEGHNNMPPYKVVYRWQRIA